MVRSIEVLLDLGSLPAFMQVKGGFPTLQRVACPAAFPRFFRTHADHLPTFLTHRQAGSGGSRRPVRSPTAATMPAYATPLAGSS